MRFVKKIKNPPSIAREICKNISPNTRKYEAKKWADYRLESDLTPVYKMPHTYPVIWLFFVYSHNIDWIKVCKTNTDNIESTKWENLAFLKNIS